MNANNVDILEIISGNQRPDNPFSITCSLQMYATRYIQGKKLLKNQVQCVTKMLWPCFRFGKCSKVRMRLFAFFHLEGECYRTLYIISLSRKDKSVVPQEASSTAMIIRLKYSVRVSWQFQDNIK